MLFQLPKAALQSETLPIANQKKNNFSGPEKLFFYFPFQALLGAGPTLFRCFSGFPKRHCKGRPFQLQIRKNNNFSGAEKLFFFIFPSRHSWEQALSFSVAFPAAQSGTAKRDPSNCKLEKNNFSGPEKLFFIFPSRHS